MINDYIRRENMLNAVEKLDIIPSVDGMGNPTNAEDYRVQFLGTVLKVEPADVAPVVHGEYIGEYDGYADGNPVCDMWYCSVCGCCFEDWDEKPTYNFCPNCGAKMDGKEEV